MNIAVTQKRLEDLSDLTYEVNIGKSSEVDYCDIMILKFIGEYRFGSQGNSDARSMRAIGEAVLEAWNPRGLLIDLRDLSYEWGDQLEDVFYIGSDKYRDRPFPVAVLVGKNSEEAVRTLIVGPWGTEKIDEIGWVFKDVTSAWAFIEAKLKEYHLKKML